MTRRERFVERYGGVYEHSAWVAERAFDTLGERPSAGDVRAALAASVDGAAREQQLTLIRAHPDLAGKAARKGALTEESSAEQKSAGIDQCDAEEYALFQDLNARYKAKFGFPFVIAVRGLHRRDVLAAFSKRLGNSAAAEFATAITEIHKIATLRLGDLERDMAEEDD